MTLNTSTHFASAGAQGTDWRDTARSVLEQLQSIRTEQDEFTLGFLYISDDLAEDAQSILSLFKSVTGIDNWVGCVGVGVCANGHSYLDQPAIAALIAKLPEDDFQILPGTSLGQDQVSKFVTPWLMENDPFCALIHGDAESEAEPAKEIDQLSEILQSFLVGGLSSSRSAHYQFANDVYDNGICGVIFSQNQNIMTGLSQGCKTISAAHTITRAHDNMIMELDHKPAFEVFTQDVRDYAKAHCADIAAPGQRHAQSKSAEAISPRPRPPEEIVRGDVHLAFPVQGTDMKDYIVRNIIDLDAEHGWISTGRKVVEGDEIILVRRDRASMEEDFSKMLLNLRRRMSHNDIQRPKAGIFISCMARSGIAEDKKAGCKQPTNELELIREIIGDIPLVGYYASGEISNSRLYAYAGLLILFND